jgi:arylsulfatase A-like enzyme
MGDQAMAFLDSSKGKGKPFCLSVSFKAPHIEDGDPRQFIPDSADLGLYANATMPISPNSEPAFFNALPPFLKDPNTELRLRWGLEFNTPTKYQESMKNYYRLISGVDHVVGRIRAKLAAMGVAGNTVIIYTADNGFFAGDRGYSGKWLSHDPSIRVPLIVYDPRLAQAKKGVHRKEMALNIDVAATLLSLGGVPAPVTMQGRDLMGLINGTTKNWRSEYLHDYTLFLCRGRTSLQIHRLSFCHAGL